MTEPENPDGEKPPVTEPENPDGEKPPVTEPENPDGEKPPVTEPENPDGEKPPVTEPENPDGEKPPVTEPENPDGENPGETEEPPYFVDEEGNKVDKDGYLVDDEGNQILDENGNPVKAEDKDKIQGDLEDINKPPLTPEEQEALDELGGKADAITGETSREELEAIQNSPLYDRLTAEQKKAVEDALAALALLEQPVIPPVGGTLYERLMAAASLEEYDAIWNEAAADERNALTAEELAALEAHRAALEGVELPHNEGYIPYVTPEDSVNVGPLVASKAKETNTLGPQKTQRRAMARQVDPDSDPVLPGNRVEGLHTKKTYNAATGELTIEAYAEATVKPADIVLVLDQSEMMSYCNGCGQMIPKEDHIGAGHLIYDGQKCGHSLKTDRLTDNYVKTVNGVDYYQFRSGTEAMTAMNGLEAKDFKTLAGGSECSKGIGDHTFGRMWIAGVDKSGNITGDHIGRDGYVGVTKKCEFFGNETYDTREKVMEEAVNEFLNTMAEKNDQISEEAYKHRVAVVGYNNDAETLLGMQVISSTPTIGYQVEKETTNKPSTGLDKAKEILDNADYTGVERDRIVILFTSGRPGEKTDYRAALVSGGTAFDSTEAAAMQDAASALGETTLYSIGVYSGASSSSENQDSSYKTVPKSDDNLEQNANGEWVPPVWDNQASRYANHLLTQISNGGFSSASNTETLQSVFEEIGNQIQAKVDLTNPVLQDVISQYFKISERGNVSAEAVSMTTNGGAEPVDVEVNGKTVKVVDFDFSAAENVVLKDKNGNMLRGRKLVVTIPIERENEFWGGNNVPTNVTSQSGIFDQGGTVCVQGLKNEEGEVKSPRTDVPLLDVQLIPQDVNIYYSNHAPGADELHKGNKIRVQYADGKWDDVDYSTLGWRTDYAKLNTPAVLDPDTQEISNIKDGEYTVSRVVEPTESGTVVNGTAKFAEGKKANVNVFTPTVSFGDMRTYLTVVAPVEEHMPESVVWKHSDVVADSVEMVGKAPELTYDIVGRVNAQNGEGTNQYDRDYYAIVKAVQGNDTDIPLDKVTFEHHPCDDIVRSINFEPKIGQFLVHVFKPTVTFQDTTTYKGMPEFIAEEYRAKDYVKVEWAYMNNLAKVVAALPEGTPPELTFDFMTDSASLYEELYVKDTPVTAKVTKIGNIEKIDGLAIGSFVYWNWQANSDSTGGCTTSCAKPADANFTVHVKTCTLNIEKQITGGVYSDKDSFLFKVKGSGNPLADQVEMDVFITGAGTKTITGLPVGNYSVTEDRNWSWRYENTGSTGEWGMDAGKPEATYTFTNQLVNEKWLSSEDFNQNDFLCVNEPKDDPTGRVGDAAAPEERETGINDEIPNEPMED
ncbi:hypothetical protein [uncultured Oscillibacter sp.]|uniref:hypothetical protein n=1 Tax=uncultured Oscillibacter sp. TaxID=876091 RepID=UPI00263898A7|nr:hypothetical protein [uncultured Oscillibacter sp.]